MKSYMLALSGLAFAIACSSPGGEQRIPAEEDLAPPLEVARVDTTPPVAVEQQTKAQAAPEAKAPPAPKTKPAPRKARRPAKAPVDTAIALATAPKDDTSTVRGYAPNLEADSVPSDTAGADTASAVVSDREAAASPIVDTVPSPVIDSAVASRDTAPRPDDTVVTAPRDTASRAVPDTSIAVPDTSTPVPDTAVSRDAATASPAPVPTATSNVGPSTAAARTLPVGTEIHAALTIHQLPQGYGRTDGDSGRDGEHHRARRETLIAAGSPVRLTVTRLSPSRSKGAQGRLRLKVDGIGIGQELRTVSAEVQAVPHELRGRGESPLVMPPKWAWVLPVAR